MLVLHSKFTKERSQKSQKCSQNSTFKFPLCHAIWFLSSGGSDTQIKWYLAPQIDIKWFYVLFRKMPCTLCWSEKFSATYIVSHVEIVKFRHLENCRNGQDLTINCFIIVISGSYYRWKIGVWIILFLIESWD